MSHSMTKFFYLAIYSVCVALGFGAQKYSYSNTGELVCEKTKKIPLVLSFLIAWFFLAFTNIGVDYPNYKYIVQIARWDGIDQIISVEPAFTMLVLFLKRLFNNNPDQVIFALKTMYMIILFLSVYLLRQEMNIGYTILAFMLLLYLPSFYLISMTLAVSICILAISILIKKQKYFLPTLLILIAAQLHNSAYLFLFVIAAIYVLEHSQGFSSMVKILIAIGFVIVIVFAGKIFNAVSSLSGFHYGGYGTNGFSGTGLMVIVIYAPLLFILFRLMENNKNVQIRNLTFVLAASSCLFYLLSYKFRVIERMEFYMTSLYIVVIPYFFSHSNLLNYNRFSKEKNIYVTLYTLYILFRGYEVFIGRTTAASGLANYYFFNPFETR